MPCREGQVLGILRGLDGGTPMSHVNFKKSQVLMSLNLSCPMSSLRYPNVACRF